VLATALSRLARFPAPALLSPFSWTPASAVAETAAPYRARQPERTALYGLLEEHLDSYLSTYEERFADLSGPLRGHARRALNLFLECGRLQNGFARIRCGDCGAERLLAFSCQTRNLCPSCQGKRAALLGERLAEEILAPVPHGHVTFTIPKALRGLFQRDRRLLGILSRAAYEATRKVMQDELGTRSAVPGFVASLQTFGSYAANWHPHVHGILSEGLFERDGTFCSIWKLDTDAIEQQFRERVIEALQKANRLSDEFALNLLSWEHSGFSVVVGRQPGAHETRRIEEVGRYLARAPVPQDLPEVTLGGQVLIPTPPDPRTGATEIVLDPLEFIHRVAMQIPDRGQHLVRYYGAYSCRGRRAHALMDEEQGTEEQEDRPQDQTENPAKAEGLPTSEGEHAESDFLHSRRSSWARMIRRIFEVDPLLCPDCGGEMKVIAVLTDPEVVDRILRHIKAKQAKQENEQEQAPPAPRGQDPPHPQEPTG
jgi:hypothetical protein